MSIGQTFPDVLVLPDGQIRPVTHCARRWMYENTNLSDKYEMNTLPAVVSLHPAIIPMMEEDGVVIRYKRF